MENALLVPKIASKLIAWLGKQDPLREVTGRVNVTSDGLMEFCNGHILFRVKLRKYAGEPLGWGCLKPDKDPVGPMWFPLKAINALLAPKSCRDDKDLPFLYLDADKEKAFLLRPSISDYIRRTLDFEKSKHQDYQDTEVVIPKDAPIAKIRIAAANLKVLAEIAGKSTVTFEIPADEFTAIRFSFPDGEGEGNDVTGVVMPVRI